MAVTYYDKTITIQLYEYVSYEVSIQNALFANLINVSCWSNRILLSALQVKTSPCSASVTVIVETFPLESSSSPLRYQLMVIGGIPIITLQIIMIVSPLTVYTVDPTLTLMTPFSTESGSDPPRSITTASKYNNSQINVLILQYYKDFYF